MSQVSAAVSKAIKTKFHPTRIELKQIDKGGYEGETTFHLETGMTYHAIIIETNIVEDATVLKNALNFNATDIMAAKGSDFTYLEAFKQFQHQAGAYIFDFSNFEYRSMQGIRFGELVTLSTDEAFISFNLGAKGATDPAVPTFRAYAIVTDTYSDRYFIPRLEKHKLNIAASGEHEWIFPNGSPTRWVRRLHFDTSTIDISKMEIYRGLGANKKKEDTIEKARQSFMLQRWGGHAPQANKFVHDPTLYGFGIHGLDNTAGKLVYNLFVDGGGSIDVLVEMIEQVRPFDNQAG